MFAPPEGSTLHLFVAWGLNIFVPLIAMIHILSCMTEPGAGWRTVSLVFRWSLGFFLATVLFWHWSGLAYIPFLLVLVTGPPLLAKTLERVCAK